MRPLAKTFRAHGYDFTMTDRVGDVALFEKRAGTFLSFEVVIVQKHPDREIMGRPVPAAEGMPGAEQWGQKGWTCVTAEQARTKFDAVIERERVKAAERAMQ